MRAPGRTVFAIEDCLLPLLVLEDGDAACGSGFRVQGSGIRSQGQGSGFRVQAWCSLLLARLLLARFGVHAMLLVLHVTRRAMRAQRSCSSDEGRGRGDGQAAAAHAAGVS
jgi:hypothetical protein